VRRPEPSVYSPVILAGALPIRSIVSQYLSDGGEVTLNIQNEFVAKGFSNRDATRYGTGVKF